MNNKMENIATEALNNRNNIINERIKDILLKNKFLSESDLSDVMYYSKLCKWSKAKRILEANFINSVTFETLKDNIYTIYVNNTPYDTFKINLNLIINEK